MFSGFVGEPRGGGDYKNITFPYGKNLATRGHLCYNLGKEKGCVNLKHNSLIVIKVGSSSLTKRGGTLDTERLECLVSQMVRAKEEGHQIVLVTSGAIAAGFRALGFSSRPTTIRDKQASASVGQALLMEEYRRAFAQYGIACGQLLLTREDFADRRRFRNAYAALQVLLDCGAVPIINENDTVAVEELKIGDNDTLSARVAAMVHADLLVLLTDVDGLYTANPKKDQTAKHIDTVEHIDGALMALAGGAGSSVGTGGMQTKLKGAALATAAGVEVLICSSEGEECITRAIAGTARGTRFLPHHAMKTREQWLAFYAPVQGEITVDEGAARALIQDKKSLLPPGVVGASGEFEAGDVVAVYLAGTGKLLGRGIVAYGREELLRLAKTHGNHGEAIHRDNWIEGTEEV